MFYHCLTKNQINTGFLNSCKALVLNCPICQEEVELVREIRLQEDRLFQHVSAKGKKQG